MADKKTIEKTKLIQLLSSFSSLEWKRFGRFVQSPYHNTNQQVIDLYVYLKKAFPFEELKPLEQDRIYKKIYGKVPFKLNNFQSLCSDLYGLAADFIIDVHLQKEKRKREKVLIDALSERNYELFKGASQQLIKEVETQEYFFDEDDFLLLHQLNVGLYHHIETDKFTIQKTELENSWKHLNAFYEHKQVGFKAENRGSENFLNQNINSTDIPDNQLTELFQEVLNLHAQKGYTLYFQLKDKILAYWDKLKHQHKTNLLVHLLNFSFANELLQKEFGHKEALDLYKVGIENKLFIVNGKMRDIEFINISMIGFKYESEEWTINFVERHKHYLSKEVSIFLVPLAYAYNANFRNDYEQVISILSKVNPLNNIIYLEKIKTLLIRAYFEAIIKGHETYRHPLYYEIESLKKMMGRNKKLALIRVESRNNFLNLVKKLLDLYDDKLVDLQKIHSFEIHLSQTSPLVLKQWLTEKFLKIKNAAS